jgi:hypothetical protein
MTTAMTEESTAKWWGPDRGNGAYELIPFSGTPLNVSTTSWCLHRGNCHPGGENRVPVPEELLVVLWEGEHLRAEAGKPAGVYFCDRVSRRVKS